jgi:hypothetical protein
VAFLTTDNEMLQKDKTRLIEEVRVLESRASGATARLERLERENEEIKNMYNHEAVKYQIDN